MFDQETVRKLNRKARKVKRAAEKGADRMEMIRLQNELARAQKQALRTPVEEF